MKTFVKNRFGVIAALAVVLALAFGCAYSVASADDTPSNDAAQNSAADFRVTKDFLMSVHDPTPSATFTFSFDLVSVDGRTGSAIVDADKGAIDDVSISYDNQVKPPAGATEAYVHRVKDNGAQIVIEKTDTAGFQFNHAGVYKYLVTEDVPDTKVDGVTYDAETTTPHGYYVYVYVKNADANWNYTETPYYDNTSTAASKYRLKVQNIGVVPATKNAQGGWDEGTTKVNADAPGTYIDPTTGATTGGHGGMFFDNYYVENAPFKITQTVFGKDADVTLPFPISNINVVYTYPAASIYSGLVPANLVGQVYNSDGTAATTGTNTVTLTGTEDAGKTKIEYALAAGTSVNLTHGQYILFEKGATGAAATVTSVPVGSIYSLQEDLPGDTSRIQYTPTATAAANNADPATAAQDTSYHEYAKGATAYVPTPDGTTTSKITTNYIGPKSTVTPNTPVNTASFVNKLAEITPTGILLAALPWVLGLILVGGAIAYYVISRKKRDRVQA